MVLNLFPQNLRCIWIIKGIQHHKVTAKWPQADGEVERQNRSLLKRIQIPQAERKDWKKELNVYLASYRSLAHPTTGVSPAKLLFGRKIRTRLPELRDVHAELEVRDRDNKQKTKVKCMLITRERHVIQIFFRVIKS